MSTNKISQVEILTEMKFRQNVPVLEIFNGENPFFTVSLASHAAMAADIQGAFRQAMETNTVEAKFGNKVTLPNEQVLFNVHKLNDCDPEGCPIHSPSKNHMQKMSQYWNSDKDLMQRICAHGMAHPDFDDLRRKRKESADYDYIHPCDGCCHAPSKKLSD